ncbi:MAG: hypothetical protein K2N29_07730 [Ruminiclostridium sp.]|nr:hypothetical protein [Ruminiclostridium sp.]
MRSNFNNHNLTDFTTISLYQSYLTDYPNPIPNDEGDYSVYCYIEEYKENGKLHTRLRDKYTNKEVVFWTSPKDALAVEQKNGLLEFLSETKKMNNTKFYKKDGADCIVVQAILLNETSDTIVISSYFAELFYLSKKKSKKKF